MKIYTDIPEGFGECPVCNGTGVSSGNEKCRNCGWQYQFGNPCGYTYLDKNGDPCKHSYQYKKIGRCLCEYTCKNCNNSYQIDSGD